MEEARCGLEDCRLLEACEMVCLTTETIRAREMLRFTIETGVGGRAGRWFQTAVAGCVLLWHGRAMFAPVRLGPHCNGGLEVRRKRSVRNTITP